MFIILKVKDQAWEQCWLSYEKVSFFFYFSYLRYGSVSNIKVSDSMYFFVSGLNLILNLNYLFILF